MGSISVREQAEIRKIAHLEKTVALQGEVLHALVDLLRRSKFQFSEGEGQTLVSLLQRLAPKS